MSKQEQVKNWAYSKSADVGATFDIIGGNSVVKHGDFIFDPSIMVAGETLSERCNYTRDTVQRLEKKMKMLGGVPAVEKLLLSRATILNDLALSVPEANPDQDKKLKKQLAQIEERFKGTGISTDRFERYLRLKDNAENEPRKMAAQAPNMNLAAMTALRHIVAGQQSVTLTPKQMQGSEDLSLPETTSTKRDVLLE